MQIFPTKLTELFTRQAERQRDFETSLADAEAEVVRFRADMGTAALAAFDAEQSARAAPADKQTAKAAAAAFAKRDRLAQEFREAEDRVKALRAARAAADARDLAEQKRLSDAAEAEKRVKLQGAFDDIAEAAAEFDRKVGELFPILTKVQDAQEVIRGLAGDCGNYAFGNFSRQIAPCVGRRLRPFTGGGSTSQDPKYDYWATFAPTPDMCGIKLTEKD